jgi:hypothetical protein
MQLQLEEAVVRLSYDLKKMSALTVGEEVSSPEVSATEGMIQFSRLILWQITVLIVGRLQCLGLKEPRLRSYKNMFGKVLFVKWGYTGT